MSYVHPPPIDFIERNGVIPDSERNALIDIHPKGFFIRHPPAPHELDEALTPEASLFQTIHMGAAVVDASSWKLVVDGLVERPFPMNLEQLRQMPSKSVTSFHECYGSPITPPTKNVWRIGNVRWTGVPLQYLLSIARPDRERGLFVWSDGLDSGTFAGVSADRYQKDLPIEKALSPEVLIAYEMNGQPLTKERGGPVRLVVPGWFGTNSTKWLCRLSVQATRSAGPFTTVFYNELDPTDSKGIRKRPVWKVEPNSIIVRPRPEEVVIGSQYVEGWGRAWGADEIVRVEVSLDHGDTWNKASVVPRKQFEWQLFSFRVYIHRPGRYDIQARATDESGAQQPLLGRRNHVPTVRIYMRSRDT
ncbi:sulfite reductase [Aspergillus sclerotioniger CBS 115572]|uniref:Sulfite reductase n=1 Tax=Aspergillus sclerotioniger CBS 115572 TaxID=1450535 RepID=A0A317W5I3_9EURO|nr:sulfite reductase [Aspergillus sclerotioniger CBS 115572]PWY81603.1 sulfite reductase [Aspergillus sclerotioniger CBS 115572]